MRSVASASTGHTAKTERSPLDHPKICAQNAHKFYREGSRTESERYSLFAFPVANTDTRTHYYETVGFVMFAGVHACCCTFRPSCAFRSSMLHSNAPENIREQPMRCLLRKSRSVSTCIVRWLLRAKIDLHQ